MTKRERIQRQIRDLPVETYELSPELRDTLRERLAAAKANPEAGIPWEEVRASILKTL